MDKTHFLRGLVHLTVRCRTPLPHFTEHCWKKLFFRFLQNSRNSFHPCLYYICQASINISQLQWSPNSQPSIASMLYLLKKKLNKNSLWDKLITDSFLAKIRLKLTKGKNRLLNKKISEKSWLNECKCYTTNIRQSFSSEWKEVQWKQIKITFIGIWYETTSEKLC